jgi:hypothetical protein
VRDAHLPKPDRLRAALTAATPLTTALGRPNREQVVTTRTSAPTTLQTLELLNGATLAERLSKGAEQLAGESLAPRALVEAIFMRALGRAPRPPETALALETLGPRPSSAAIEDVLWGVAMLPEFQLVR